MNGHVGNVERREIWAKLESQKRVWPGREVFRTHCWGVDSPFCSSSYDPSSGRVAARCLFLNHSSAGSLTLLKNLLWLLFSWVLWFGIHDPLCSNLFFHCSFILPFPLPDIYPYTKTKTIFSFFNKTLQFLTSMLFFFVHAVPFTGILFILKSTCPNIFSFILSYILFFSFELLHLIMPY